MTAYRTGLLRLTVLWCAGACLRLTILAVPPLILAIESDLHLSATGVGLLTGLPVAMFALAAVPGSLLIARLGSARALICGLLLVAGGAALRGFAWQAGTLYAATAITGAGVAVMQPCMPVLVREWLPSRIGLATAVYSNGLLAGEILVVWLTPLILPLLGGDWRAGLAVWALPAVITALAVATLAGRAERKRPKMESTAVWRPDWSDPLIWRLGLLFGCVNASYFAGNTFLPAHLDAAGYKEFAQPALTALNLAQIPASLLIMIFAKRLERRAWPYVLAGLALTVSVLGVVFMPGAWAVLWSGLLGFSVAAGLILGLTLPALLVNPKDVGRTSAAMFTLSYAMAVLLALLCGGVSDVTGNAAAAFIPIAVCAAVLSASALGLRAAGRLI